MKTALLTLALCLSSLPAFPITPEQALDQYDRQLQEDLFIRAPINHVAPPLIQPEPGDTPTPKANYIQPAKGMISSGYGWRWGRMHKGIDIAAPVGTPIIASADGQVISSGWNAGGYGLLVEISHQNGSITRYAHNSKSLVSVGQSVSQGQAIALMGSTGNSTGSHCHFEILPDGRRSVNPTPLLSRATP